MRLDGVDYQIIGVLPRGFFLESPADVWMPASTTFDMMGFATPTGAHDRAQEAGADPRAVEADLDGFSKRLTEAHSDIYPPLASA